MKKGSNQMRRILIQVSLCALINIFYYLDCHSQAGKATFAKVLIAMKSWSTQMCHYIDWYKITVQTVECLAGWTYKSEMKSQKLECLFFFHQFFLFFSIKFIAIIAIWGQFHQRSTSTFNARGSWKRKKYSQVVSIYTFRMRARKSCS